MKFAKKKRYLVGLKMTTSGPMQLQWLCCLWFVCRVMMWAWWFAQEVTNEIMSVSFLQNKWNDVDKVSFALRSLFHIVVFVSHCRLCLEFGEEIWNTVIFGTCCTCAPSRWPTMCTHWSSKRDNPARNTLSREPAGVVSTPASCCEKINLGLLNVAIVTKMPNVTRYI